MKQISIKIDDESYNHISQEANRREVKINDFVVHLIEIGWMSYAKKSQGNRIFAGKNEHDIELELVLK